VGTSSLVGPSWFRSFERSILHGENKGGEHAKQPQDEEATLESCMTVGPPTMKVFFLE